MAVPLQCKEAARLGEQRRTSYATFTHEGPLTVSAFAASSTSLLLFSSDHRPTPMKALCNT